MARGEDEKAAESADMGDSGPSEKFTKFVNIPDRLEAAADRLEEAAKYGRATAEIWRVLDKDDRLKHWSMAKLINSADDNMMVLIMLDMLDEGLDDIPDVYGAGSNDPMIEALREATARSRDRTEALRQRRTGEKT